MFLEPPLTFFFRSKTCNEEHSSSIFYTDGNEVKTIESSDEFNVEDLIYENVIVSSRK